MDMSFSLVDLASLIVSIISAIISFVFGYLSTKTSVAQNSQKTTIIINPITPELTNDNTITYKNNKAIQRLLFFAIFGICIVTFALSIKINYKIIPVNNITISPFLNKVFSYIFYGIGIVSKIISPTIPIFSLTLLLGNIKIKSKVDRVFNIITYFILFVSSIILTIAIIKIDFVSISAITPDHALTINNLAKSYMQMLIILQILFVAFEIYHMLGIMIIGEKASKLIEKNLHRVFIKLLMPIFTIFLSCIGITFYNNSSAYIEN